MSNFRIYNETLCPDIWDKYKHLDSRVRVNLLRLAYDFYKKTNFKAPIHDIYLMGSIANYNWTPDSDLDVHIMVDYNALQMPADTANKMVKTVGATWNSEHNVIIKGHKVEMNMQSIHEIKPHVTGIYSLVKDQWIRQPVINPPQIDKSVIQIQYQSMKKYVESAMNSGDRETMKGAKEYLDAYRQYGLDTVGELSYQNIVFKILRSKGIIKKLKEMITIAYDQEMSLKESDTKSVNSQDLFVGYVIPDSFEVKAIRADLLPDGFDGHDYLISLERDIDVNNTPAWRYRKDLNTVYWWKEKPNSEIIEAFEYWLKKKLNMTNPKYMVMNHMDIVNWTKRGSSVRMAHGIDEIGNKDIKQSIPRLNKQDHIKFGNSKYDRSYFGKYDVNINDYNLQKITLDELKSLVSKTLRFLKRWPNDKELQNKLIRYRNEIRRRLNYINKPVIESKYSHEIWLGWVDPQNYRVFGANGENYEMHDEMDAIDPKYVHELDWSDAPKWRYRKDLNTVYWWVKLPDEETKNSLNVWLKKNAGITSIPKHIRLPSISRNDDDMKAMHQSHGTMQEGVGAGKPEEDRLKIQNSDGSIRKWQIRSKNAPKTPKFIEKIVIPIDEDVSGMLGMRHSTKKLSNRDSFEEPQNLFDDVDPTIKQIINTVEKILDKKSAHGTKFFTIQYMMELMEDVMAMIVPTLSPSHPSYKSIVESIIMYLSQDYDIRMQEK